jgi:hypothetical protein
MLMFITSARRKAKAGKPRFLQVWFIKRHCDEGVLSRRFASQKILVREPAGKRQTGIKYFGVPICLYPPLGTSLIRQPFTRELFKERTYR